MNFDSTHPIDETLLQPGPKWNWPNWPRDAQTGSPLSLPLTYALGITGEIYRVEGTIAYNLGRQGGTLQPPVIPPA